MTTPVVDFRDQVAQFQKVSNNGLRWHSRNSLFIAWFGINDVAVQVYQGRGANLTRSILTPDVEDYFGLLGDLYHMGARRFLTVLVPRK